MAYGQFTGVYDWKCPQCRRGQKHRINALVHRIRCRSRGCGFTIDVGSVQWCTRPGPAPTPPLDQICMDAGTYRGHMANKAFCDGCGKLIADATQWRQGNPQVDTSIEDADDDSQAR